MAYVFHTTYHVFLSRSLVNRVYSYVNLSIAFLFHIPNETIFPQY